MQYIRLTFGVDAGALIFYAEEGKILCAYQADVRNTGRMSTSQPATVFEGDFADFSASVDQLTGQPECVVRLQDGSFILVRSNHLDGSKWQS